MRQAIQRISKGYSDTSLDWGKMYKKRRADWIEFLGAYSIFPLLLLPSFSSLSSPPRCSLSARSSSRSSLFFFSLLSLLLAPISPFSANQHFSLRRFVNFCIFFFTEKWERNKRWADLQHKWMVCTAFFYFYVFHIFPLFSHAPFPSFSAHCNLSVSRFLMLQSPPLPSLLFPHSLNNSHTDETHRHVT